MATRIPALIQLSDPRVAAQLVVGMKNRIAYLQYMPNKRHSRFGIKKFELCDATSGYVLHIELYAGKDFPIRSDHGRRDGPNEKVSSAE